MLSLKPFRCACLLVLTSLAVPVMRAQNAPATWSADDTDRIVNQVRKNLSGLTTFSVFDDLHFAIRGKTIVLQGYASRPILKSDAENAVKGIRGVESVENEIEVLPNSPMDDRIRAAVYNRLYTNASLRKYNANAGALAQQGPPSVARMAGGITQDPPIGFHSIHIIVKNGHVTLKGAVLNEMDANIAQIQANSVPGVFSVTNDLAVQNSSSKKER